MSRYALEALLRPPVEFYSTVTAGCGALICLTQAPLLPSYFLGYRSWTCSKM